MEECNFFVSVICFLAITIGGIQIKENDVLLRNTTKTLTNISVLIGIGILLDFIGIIASVENSKLIEFHKFIKVFEYILMPIIPLKIANLAGGDRYQRNTKYIARILIILNTTMQIITLVSPIMFYIDAKNNYHNTDFMYLFFAIYVISLSLLYYAFHLFSKQNQSKNTYIIYIIIIFLLIGFFMKFKYPEISFEWLTMTMAFEAIVFYYFNASLRLDSMTRLLNKGAYLNMKECINYDTVFFILDANDFKSVNDRYGHKGGDETLKMFSRAIENIYGNYGFCYRIGGDEFAVILKKGIIKEKNINSIDQMCEKLMNDLDCLLKEESKKNPMLKGGMAQGYSIYRADIDYGNIEKIIQEADQAMYFKKNSIK